MVYFYWFDSSWNSLKLVMVITLTQLEYIVAVDNHRHFAKAAEHCFVTQPTLSMQIKKLEDDSGLKSLIVTGSR